MTLAIGDLACSHPCVAFLKASPLLQEFTLKLSHTVEPCAYIQNIRDHPHLNLRVVSFIGFEGREVDVECLKDLLENAVGLEKMIIDPCKSHFMGSPVVWYCRRSEDYKSNRKCAVELAEEFPHVEFVIPEIFVPLADR